jgi:hypothetical protein
MAAAILDLARDYVPASVSVATAGAHLLWSRTRHSQVLNLHDRPAKDRVWLPVAADVRRIFLVTWSSADSVYSSPVPDART